MPNSKQTEEQSSVLSLNYQAALDFPPSLERTVTGCGAEMIMRRPQMQQSIRPACSTTEVTVRIRRPHCAHSISTICIKKNPVNESGI